MRKPALATRVSPVVNTAVRQLTKTLGITISEYLRNLILDDLESKKMFEGELKKAVEQSENEDRQESTENKVHSSIRKLLSQPEEEENHEACW